MLRKGVKYAILFSVLQGFHTLANAQDRVAKVDVQVMDNDSISLENVNLEFNPKLKFRTNSEGKLSAEVPYGTYELKISLPNYETKRITVVVERDTVLPVVLSSEFISLQEAVFTAKEGQGLTSKSVINKQAMMHLQPSSFADLMELIPGGLAKDPNLVNANAVLLRETDDRTSQYNTGSLGVQFMVDDNIINSNSDFQKALDSGMLSSAAGSRQTYQTGVDMRTISTNDIEKVEIVRGIPSASYGDLTSGLIKIERKIGQTPIQARLKVDGYSKQYYLAKGFKIKDNWSLYGSVDYLDAKNDPSDETTNYKRVTASLRSKVDLKMGGNPLQWKTNLDFTGTFDQTKVDPDTGYDLTDKYKSYNRRVSLANNFIYKLDKSNFFNQFILNTAIQQGFDRIEQTKLVQYTGPRAISLATEPGENIGFYPELKFISDSYTDGKPLDIQAKFEAKGNRFAGEVVFDYEVGADWKYSKNNGEGDVFDLMQPPSPTMNTRPRSFKSIPASQILSFYGGNTLKYKIQNHGFNLYTGFRASSMLGVDSSYKISGKIYIEPRINFQYNLPKLYIAGSPLKIDLTAGYGEFYKQPTNLALYPTKQYNDYAQLSYYNNDERYRYVNYMTYVTSLENKNLVAAKNIKKEFRIDLDYKHHNLAVTFYKENMNNGFRNVDYYNVHTYKKYDASQVDVNSWGPNGPDLSNVPYEDVRTFALYTKTENGSVTDKQGIEFQYSTPRFKAINTRFTLSGAWFKTKYYNSVPMYYKPSISIGGMTGGLPYIGIYENDEGYKNSQMNYNLMIDTYIPRLDLTFSASVQGKLFTNNYRLAKVPTPFAYMDLNGDVFDYTEADQSDIYKQWLVRNVSETDYMSNKTSYTVNVNFKVTKSIYKAVRASMFVNRLFNYQNPYTFNGVNYKPKSDSSPYFGMEINYNF